MEPTIYDICPKCGSKTESEGVHNGVGYVYPPLHCYDCGWSELCWLGQTENCTKKCTNYEKCKANFAGGIIDR